MIPAEVANYAEFIASLNTADRQEMERKAAQLVKASATPQQAAEGAEAARLAPIRRALFEDAQSVWDAEGPPRVEIDGGCGLLWEGVGVYLFGPRGAGKSISAQTVELSAAMQGVKVLHFDRENAAPLARDRLNAAIAANGSFDEATIRQFYASRHYPHFDLKWKAEDYADAIAEQGFRVVAYDSVRETLQQLHLSSNSDDDWSELYALLGTPLIERGIAPLFLDNVGLKATQRPRGSAAKLDAVPQGFRVWSMEQFSPEITGRIGIECIRSRYGDEDRLWTMTIGGGHWELPSEEIERIPTTTSWGAILRELEDGEPHLQGEVADAVGLTVRQVERLVRGNLRSEEPEIIKRAKKGEPTTLELKGVGNRGLRF